MRDIMISTGYYDAQWRKYESGGSLNVASLMKIALALDVPLSELLDGLGQWPKLSVAEIQAKDAAKLESLKVDTELIAAKRPSPGKAKKDLAAVNGANSHTTQAIAPRT